MIFVLAIILPYPNQTQPCIPSPCQNGDICEVYNDQIAICNSCSGPNAIINPMCRPECLMDSDCPFDKACLSRKCSDPCPGSCGVNARCATIYHNPVCSCPTGLYGNPYEYCSVSEIPEERTQTCNALKCGDNTECKQLNGILACICKNGYFGDPLIGCHPECVVNSDCAINKVCVGNKCNDPCIGACGVGALCEAVNHYPVCFCPPETSGDALVSCNRIVRPPHVTPGYLPPNPCDPSPCGPNSRCLIFERKYAVCSCLPEFRGMPPLCQSECLVSTDCQQIYACANQKCIDPCPGACGIGSRCDVVNHKPICTCPPGTQGDPFTSCQVYIEEPKTKNPCIPTPCGPNSICQVKQGRPVCSCAADNIGSPPHCRPECVINQECPRDKACIQEKCKNPCTNNCGQNAKCDVVNHTPFCSCLEGYQGDAFVGCSLIPKRKFNLLLLQFLLYLFSTTNIHNFRRCDTT